MGVGKVSFQVLTETTPMDQRTTSAKAISSLRLGLLSFLFTALTGLPAVIQGIRSLREIRRHPDRLLGRRLALSGISTGLLGTLLSGALWMLAVEKVRD